MKNTLKNSALFVVLVTLSLVPAMAQEHDHDALAHEQKLELNQGKKWTIDESLHTGMTRIKREVEVHLEDIHTNKFSAVQYESLAQSLGEHLNFLFKNCQLEPQADAQLHILLAQIMRGIEKMKHTENQQQGVSLIVESLHIYPVYFDDPYWMKLKH